MIVLVFGLLEAMSLFISSERILPDFYKNVWSDTRLDNEWRLRQLRKKKQDNLAPDE